ncbi:MAG: SEC-C domain-containing protein [Myxococcales bacterium]|nr:SEC-C domain-containing protein [Myxococcales bacterium]
MSKASAVPPSEHVHGPGCSHDHDHHHDDLDPSVFLARQPFIRPDPKIGRNDPCSCGSGKKFKKCHGA